MMIIIALMAHLKYQQAIIKNGGVYGFKTTNK